MEPRTGSLAVIQDDDLVLLAQAGDHDAFAELLSRHRSNCMKLAVSILRNLADAEDEVQNAAWKAFENIGRFHRDSKFTTWLTRIVVNQCLMRLRQIKRARLLYIDDAVPGEDVMALELPSHDASPEELLGRAQVAGLIDVEIGRIPPLLKNVVLLRDIQRLPMPTVARQLGVSIAAAKSRLLRARTELRQRMTKHQGRSGPATILA